MFFNKLLFGLIAWIMALSAFAATVTLPQVICKLEWKPVRYTETPYPYIAPSPTVLSNTVYLPALLGIQLGNESPSKYFYAISIQGLYGYGGTVTPMCSLEKVNRFMLASDGKQHGVELLIQGEPSMDGFQLLVDVTTYQADMVVPTPAHTWNLVTKYTYISPEPVPPSRCKRPLSPAILSLILD